MIGRAIRASIRELQNNSASTLSDEEVINRAIHACISEAGRHPVEGSGQSKEDAEYQKTLEKSIQNSLASYLREHPGARDGADTDDEEMKLAIRASKEAAARPVVDSDEDKDFKLALQRSKEEHEKSSTEEEIVLQYIKKQSLVEEALRLKKQEHQAEQSQMLHGRGKELGKETGGESAADDKALNMAIEESLKATSGGPNIQSGAASDTGQRSKQV